MSANDVTIVEVGPRDGLQNERRTIPTARKVAFIDALAAAGLQRIEATAFVSAERIPQLADAEAVLAGITRRPGVRYSALVPNAQGLTRALAARVDEIAVFTAASESFTRKNINATIDESFARFRDVVAGARQAGIPVRGYVSTILHCPYEGRIDEQRAVSVVRRLFDLGCYEVSLGETIGRATPREVRHLVNRIEVEGLLSRCAGHFHDTFGLALANVMAALEEGLRVFDSSAGGLGGCPYAAGASGNVATEDLQFLMEGMGLRTGVDAERLVDASLVMEETLGKTLPSRALRAHAARRRAATNRSPGPIGES